jgi:dTDP-4-dehydrorhamnose reductase
MKVLVTGANGLLGQSVVRQLLDQHHEVVATGRGPDRLPFSFLPGYQYYAVDLKEEFGLQEVLLRERPEVLIHTAAMTQVDHCEINQDDCLQVNVFGTANAIRSAKHCCQHFIFVSTDFVFDGEKGNYRENDKTGPVNWYGYTKIQAEKLVSSCEIPWAIVRTCLVYGNSLDGTRSNIISWVREKLKKNEAIQVVNDQIRTPTYVEDLSHGILLVLNKRALGLFHISGKDLQTPYDMAVQTARHFGMNEQLIEKVDAATFRQAAVRPAKTGFIIDKARRELGYEPVSFGEGLKKMYPL